MSGVVEKIKDKVDQVLHKDHNTHATSTQTTGTRTSGKHTSGKHTSGTHTSGAHTSSTQTSGTRTTGTHTTGTHTTSTHGHSTNTGPHSSSVANKLDPRVDSDRDGSRNMGAANYGSGGQTTGTGFGTGIHSTSTTAGPHHSDIANKLDPRVDSDRDGSRNMGAATYGPGGHSTGTHDGMTGTGTYSGIAGSGTSTAGPHKSNMLNKVDPRVDSDRDGSRNMGAANYGPGGHSTGTHSGMTGTGTHSDITGSGNTTGPHKSNLLNKADPRVDSDRDGSRNMGIASYGPGGQATGIRTGQTGTYTAGPHDSNFLNKADPRVDSDRDGSRNMGAASYGVGGQTTASRTNQTGNGYSGNGYSGMHTGTGPASNTAGPHGSNLANKLDPRVDSDLDGSRTMGGNQTMGGSQSY